MRGVLPLEERFAFSAADAAAVSGAFSGSSFALTALVVRAFPGRSPRSPAMVVGQLAVRKFIESCMSALWVELLTLDVLGAPAPGPAAVRVHCNGGHGFGIRE